MNEYIFCYVRDFIAMLKTCVALVAVSYLVTFSIFVLNLKEICIQTFVSYSHKNRNLNDFLCEMTSISTHNNRSMQYMHIAKEAYAVNAPGFVTLI